MLDCLAFVLYFGKFIKQKIKPQATKICKRPFYFNPAVKYFAQAFKELNCNLHMPMLIKIKLKN